MNDLLPASHLDVRSWPAAAASNSILVVNSSLKLSLRQASALPKLKKILQCFGSSVNIHGMQDADGSSYFQNVRLVRLIAPFDCPPEAYTLSNDFASDRLRSVATIALKLAFA